MAKAPVKTTAKRSVRNKVAPKPKPKRKRSSAKSNRPTIYTEALGRKIIARLADGQGLNKICSAKSMPLESVVREWVIDDVEGFAAKYARARDIGLDVRAERLGQRAESAEGKDSAGVQAVRLIVDTEKWYLSKLAPKRYGDRLDLNVDAKVEVRELTDDQLEGRITGIVDNLIDKIGVLLTTKYRDKDEDR